MHTYILYSAQTGTTFGVVSAQNENDALDQFARSHGHASCADMWAAGNFEYVSAYQELNGALS